MVVWARVRKGRIAPGTFFGKQAFIRQEALSKFLALQPSECQNSQQKETVGS
jgi:hypothetical protein